MRVREVVSRQRTYSRVVERRNARRRSRERVMHLSQDRSRWNGETRVGEVESGQCTYSGKGEMRIREVETVQGTYCSTDSGGKGRCASVVESRQRTCSRVVERRNARERSRERAMHL